MAEYLILKRLKVQRANTIAGLTYGFPSVGSFLGLSHALGRDLEEKGYADRIVRICILHHRHQLHLYQNRFIQQRQPLLKDGGVRPIVEEGKMELEVSLLCVLEQHSPFTDQMLLTDDVRTCLMRRRLAGGAIIEVGGCDYCDGEEELRRQLYALYPFAALADRSDLLREEQHSPDDLAAFMSFCELRRSCIRDDKGQVTWDFVRRYPGFLVPCHYGYRALTDIFTADEVHKRALSRPQYGAVFAEPVHSVAEWVCSVAKFMDYHSRGRMTWEYFQDQDFYLFNHADWEDGDRHGA